MEFFRITHDIPFMRHALVFNVISLVTFIIAVILLAVRGLNLGVDKLLQLGFELHVHVDKFTTNRDFGRDTGVLCVRHHDALGRGHSSGGSCGEALR